MTDSPTHSFIGVDGGGTSCRIALVHQGQRSEVTLGRANVSSDFDGAIRTLREGLHAVGARAGASPQTLHNIPAYLGLAGVLSTRLSHRVAAALPLNVIRVEDDRISTLTGALDGHDGAVAGVGTGSFLARQSGAQTHLIGGYGFRIGDEASGAWLGRALLARTLQALDGLVAPSPLSERVLARLGGAAAGVVEFATSAAPEDFGTFAPDIVTAALGNDPIARSLMNAGAAYISDGLRALNWQTDEPVCLTGGVGPHYMPYLQQDVRNAIKVPKGSGLDGALILAARFSAETSGARE